MLSVDCHDITRLKFNQQYSTAFVNLFVQSFDFCYYLFLWGSFFFRD